MLLIPEQKQTKLLRKVQSNNSIMALMSVGAASFQNQLDYKLGDNTPVPAPQKPKIMPEEDDDMAKSQDSFFSEYSISRINPVPVKTLATQPSEVANAIDMKFILANLKNPKVIVNKLLMTRFRTSSRVDYSIAALSNS